MAQHAHTTAQGAGGTHAADAPAWPAELARPHWQAFLTATGWPAPQRLDAGARRVARHARDECAGSAVHRAEDAAGHTRVLQALPALMPAAWWPAIEAGVQQRMRLLEAVLADLYGAQQLLREGALPAAAVLAHPCYLRPMHALAPVGGARLLVAAFDLAVDERGAARVCAQRLQALSGLGELLAHRRIVAEQFGDAFAALQVRRVVPHARAWLEALARRSGAAGEARIVLLAAGEQGPDGFEAATLARELGLPLVEGADLTVRQRRLYLKALRGLQPVHVLLRGVADEWVDPLELRADSALGIPGLLQAMRQGSVLVANGPGTGVLQMPQLDACWATLAPRLLGAPLQLAQAVPHAGAAGATPVWVDGRWQAREVVWRVLALADAAGGWQVLPGALARLGAAPAPGPADVGSTAAGPDTQASLADGWLLASDAAGAPVPQGGADAGVDPGAAQATAPAGGAVASAGARAGHGRGGGDESPGVTSRQAEHLYWFGRYTERAEYISRLVAVTAEALPEGGPAALRMLQQLCQRHAVWCSSAAVPGLATGAAGRRAFLVAAVAGLDAARNPDGLGAQLQAMRRCALALRERLSAEHWKLVHEAVDHFEQHRRDLARDLDAPAASADDAAGDVPGLVARTAMHLAAITGAQTDRMRRDDGWRLLSIGRQVERIDTLAQALEVAWSSGALADDEGFGALLALFDSAIAYRAAHRSRRDVLALLQLLVADAENPRALAWVARTLRERLRKLALPHGPWQARAVAAVPAPEQWPLPSWLEYGALAQATLQACVQDVRALSDDLGRVLFAHAQPPEHSTWQ